MPTAPTASAAAAAENSYTVPAAMPRTRLQVVPVPLPLVSDISTLRISIPADLRPPEARKAGERATVHFSLPAC